MSSVVLSPQAKRYVRFCISLYKHQISTGNYFLHEHPWLATSWLMPEMDGLVNYYSSIGEASGLGVLIYSRDWANYTPAQAERLAEIQNVVAWKDGTADIRTTSNRASPTFNDSSNSGLGLLQSSSLVIPTLIV